MLAAQRGRGGVRDHVGRDVRGAAVRQPVGDPDAHGRPARDGVPERLHPFCDPSFAGGTGRFPQISGLKVQFHCNGTTPVVDTIWKAPEGVTGPLTVLGPADTVRIVTNDFLYGGGDGYTVFAGGTNVAQPGDDLLQVAIDWISAHSPVDPVVEGRIVGP